MLEEKDFQRKADPLGVTPIDDEDLGSLVLLVPCDSGDAGCAENAVVTTNVAPTSSARITNSLATTTPLTPRENVASWRARMVRQYRVPIVGAPKN